MQKKSEKTIKNNDNRMIMGLVLMCLMLAMGIFVAVVALNQKEREITRLEEEIGRLEEEISSMGEGRQAESSCQESLSAVEQRIAFSEGQFSGHDLYFMPWKGI